MNMAFKSWVMDEQMKEEEEQLMKKTESKQKAKKKCLSCNSPFESKGKYNRICNECKRTEYWGTGNDYRVIV